MALIMFDGFDAYPWNESQNPEKRPETRGWWQQAPWNPCDNYGRNGGICAVNGTGGPWISQPFAGDFSNGFYVGFAIARFNYGGSTPYTFFGLHAGTDTPVVSIVRGTHDENTAQHLQLVVGETPLYTHYAAPDVWYYFEIAVVDGQIELRINGETVYLDATLGLGSGFSHLTMLHYNGGNWYGWIDDLYVCSGENVGDGFHQLLGPVNIRVLYPTADAVAEWHPDSGSSHYTQVDDFKNYQYSQYKSHDSDGSYIHSDTSGAKDLFRPTLPTGYENPGAIQVVGAVGHEDGAGTSSVTLVAQSGAALVEGPRLYLGSHYQLLSGATLTQDPATGGKWTPEALTALQFGVINKNGT